MSLAGPYWWYRCRAADAPGGAVTGRDSKPVCGPRHRRGLACDFLVMTCWLVSFEEGRSQPVWRKFCEVHMLRIRTSGCAWVSVVVGRRRRSGGGVGEDPSGYWSSGGELRCCIARVLRSVTAGGGSWAPRGSPGRSVTEVRAVIHRVVRGCAVRGAWGGCGCEVRWGGGDPVRAGASQLIYAWDELGWTVRDSVSVAGCWCRGGPGRPGRSPWTAV